jgi:hypothetical protein
MAKSQILKNALMRILDFYETFGAHLSASSIRLARNNKKLCAVHSIRANELI